MEFILFLSFQIGIEILFILFNILNRMKNKDFKKQYFQSYFF